MSRHYRERSRREPIEPSRRWLSSGPSLRRDISELPRRFFSVTLITLAHQFLISRGVRMPSAWSSRVSQEPPPGRYAPLLATCVVASYKGGAGKTGVAVPIAERLAFAGLRVLLMTCDTQEDARYRLGVMLLGVTCDQALRGGHRHCGWHPGREGDRCAVPKRAGAHGLGLGAGASASFLAVAASALLSRPLCVRLG